MMTYTERLMRQLSKGSCCAVPHVEIEAFRERMFLATEEQRKADRRAQAMSEMRARFRWIG